jgi:aromatic ring-opening dioxygenase catalytic subunit (LigB family)
MGEALADIQRDGLLIIGSGFSFHNMRAFFSATTHQEEEMNIAFEKWLIETCTSEEKSESSRKDSLINWTEAPHARYCHPREEHLLPLHVCYGINKSACCKHYSLKILGKRASFYLW